MKDYNAIFESIEEVLLKAGSKNLPKKLDGFKHLHGQTFSDNEYFSKLIDVIFYSGFRASTVTEKIDVIHKHFPNFEIVARYDEQAIKNILADEKMIRNRLKIKACVENAKTFNAILFESGSFQNYIDSFSALSSFENLILLKEELEYRFAGLGRITTYHYLTDIGMPVLKPDRVICRIFKRLGLIENEQQLLKTVIQGRKFAEATGLPIRYIDVVFVVYGQVQSKEFGIERGICLETNPSCQVCGARDYCNYYSQQSG
ncbi:MAG: DNA-3-methyladenine glycosylase I [Anaerolineales bacterium]|nr:DNA-3-methyladenine glycosylase I [Anaerolineales bacterium]